MTTIAAGQEQTLSIQEGQSLNIAGVAGTAGVAYLLDPALGGRNSTKSWPIGTGALAQIGPYAGTQRVLITCSVGSVEAAVGNAVMGAAQLTTDVGNNVTLSANGRSVPLYDQSLNRAPGNGDNATMARTIASIWQAGRRLWQPVAAPDLASAAWAELPVTGGGFCDIVGADTLAAWGFVCEKTGYASEATDISVIIAGVPTPFTINLLANGEYDGAAHRNAARQADAGTYVTCTKQYDQSGNGNHLTKHGSYAAPIVDFSFVTGRYFLTGEGQGGTPRTLQMPAGVIASGTAPLTSGFGVTGNNFMIYALGAGNVAAGNGGAYIATLGDMDNATVADRRRYSLFCSAAGALQGVGAVAVTPVTPVPSNSQLAVTIFNVNGTAATISNDERTGAATIANNALVYTGGWLFQNQGSSTQNYAALQLTSLGIAKAAQSAARMTALRQSAYARFDIRPQVTRQIFIVSDSRGASALPLTKRFDSVAVQVVPRLGKAARVYSMCNGAYQANQLRTTVVPTVVAQYAVGVETTVFVLGAGINNFLVGNTTAAQALVDLKALIAALQSPLAKIILVNELATSSATNGANLKIVELRALIATEGAAGMGVSKIRDLLTLAPLADPTNTTFYYDGIHPTAAADAVIASALIEDC